MSRPTWERTGGGRWALLQMEAQGRTKAVGAARGLISHWMSRSSAREET